MKIIADRKATLLDILQSLSPDSSKNTLRSWLEAGRVMVDKKLNRRANAEILPGQEIAVGPKVSFLKGSLRILHEDEDLIVLEKPEGLLSVATDTEKRATVHSILKRRFHNRRVYPVHRLDRETSGVMIFAYTEKARDSLKTQFEEHKIDKIYFAIVGGLLLQEKGTWECYLEEDDFYYVKSTGDFTSGKLAVTHFEVLERSKNYSFLKLKPQTGRKNQLRVHCSEAGFPIVSLVQYLDIERDAQRADAARKTIKSALDYQLALTDKVSNPFDYARQPFRVYKNGKAGDQLLDGFFIPHANETNYWWQGESARLASLATAAILGGRIVAPDSQARFGVSPRLAEFAQNQLDWTLGRNPFDMCLLYGFGANNVPSAVSAGEHVRGGISNGITGAVDSDEGRGIVFAPGPDDNNWRWLEQWLPHSTWFLLAATAMTAQ